MRGIFGGLSRDMLVVSGLTLAAQAAIAVSQLILAAMFGASADTDAFFAALAPPLYVTTVLVASLSVVFVPIFIERRTSAGEDDAREVASSAINATVILLIAIAIAGAAFADPIIGLTAPGLPPAGRELARGLAVILWPSVVGSGLVALLTALWQIGSRFGRSAAVPFVGAVVNLTLLVLLGRTIGIWGAAIAWTVSLLLQAVLLVPVLRPLWRPSLAIGHPGVRAVFAGVAPLVLAAVFIRAGTLLERYLGSELPSGQLSQLTYASRVVAILGILVSAGPSAVLLPRMAEDVGLQDLLGLRARASRGLRSLWIVVAPLVALLVALAEPGVRLAFEHGAFTRADSEQVALLTRVYAPVVLVTALASVTGRAIYALKAIRLLSVVGALEGIAYIVYTTLLAHRFGAVGIALGSTIYVCGSITWQAVYLRRALTARGRGVGASLVSTGAIAVLAGIAAWLSSRSIDAPLVAVFVGGVSGLIVYAAGVAALRAAGRPWS